MDKKTAMICPYIQKTVLLIVPCQSGANVTLMEVVQVVEVTTQIVMSQNQFTMFPQLLIGLN